MNKQLRDMTVEALREEFIAPLSQLVVDLTNDTERFARAIRARDVPRDYLPMNVKGAQKALKALRSFYRRELHDKLEDSLEGTYRWRDAERRSAKQTKPRKKRASS